MNMYPDSALIVAGIVFAVVALMHLLRLVYRWPITIAGRVIPMSASTIGFIVALLLAIWMFAANHEMRSPPDSMTLKVQVSENN